MKRTFLTRQLPLALLATGLVLGAAAWQGKPSKNQEKATHNTSDTIPDRKVRNIDDALAELERGRKDLEQGLKQADWDKMQMELESAMRNVDAKKIQADVERAMKEVDMAAIRKQVDEALKQIDTEKMKADIEKAMASIDKEKMRIDLEKAMKEIDAEKIRAQVEASLSKIDRQKIEQELQKVREIDMVKVQNEMRDLRPKIEKAMAEAGESLEKAKAELTNYKTLIDGLDKEGLIRKEGSFTIQYKSGKLLIDGKEQPASLVKKFPFLENQRDFTIKQDKDDFNIDKD